VAFASTAFAATLQVDVERHQRLAEFCETVGEWARFSFPDGFSSEVLPPAVESTVRVYKGMSGDQELFIVARRAGATEDSCLVTVGDNPHDVYPVKFEYIESYSASRFSSAYICAISELSIEMQQDKAIFNTPLGQYLSEFRAELKQPIHEASENVIHGNPVDYASIRDIFAKHKKALDLPMQIFYLRMKPQDRNSVMDYKRSGPASPETVMDLINKDSIDRLLIDAGKLMEEVEKWREFLSEIKIKYEPLHG